MKSLVGDLAKPGSCDYVLGGSEFGIPDEKAWRQESGCRKHNERNGKDRGGVVVSCALLGLIPNMYLIPGNTRSGQDREGRKQGHCIFICDLIGGG